jgi:hypothetical protein
MRRPTKVTSVICVAATTTGIFMTPISHVLLTQGIFTAAAAAAAEGDVRDAHSMHTRLEVDQEGDATVLTVEHDLGAASGSVSDDSAAAAAHETHILQQEVRP